jgi:hypothetical protein
MHVNGGVTTIRKTSQKPYEATKVSDEVWMMLYKHFHAIEEIVVAASQR